MARNKSFPGNAQELETVSAENLGADTSNSVGTFVAPTDQAIRERAFELFQSRGAAKGTEIGDWVAAERQLTKAARRQARGK